MEEDSERATAPHGVRDTYVARRVAEHWAATAEASRREAEQQEAAGAPPETRFGFYIVLGLVTAVLLLLFIFFVTR